METEHHRRWGWKLAVAACVLLGLVALVGVDLSVRHLAARGQRSANAVQALQQQVLGLGATPAAGPPVVPSPGMKGDQGTSGRDGRDGLDGAVGPRGTGSPGSPGSQGRPGVNGGNGVNGLTGPPGVTGTQGPAGPQGATGPQGDTGATGPKGDPGDPPSSFTINYAGGSYTCLLTDPVANSYTCDVTPATTTTVAQPSTLTLSEAP